MLQTPTQGKCYYFTWIIFVELNFKFAFLLIRKAWSGRFVNKVWGMGNFKKWLDPSNGGMVLKWGVLIPLYGLWTYRMGSG